DRSGGAPRVRARVRDRGGRMRILIVLPGALGDVIRALPLVGRIRRGRPDAVVGWAVEPPSAPLLVEHPWVDRVLVFERAGGPRASLACLRALGREPWDVALDLGRGAKSAVMAIASRARDRIGFARADAREGGWLLTRRHIPAQGTARSKLMQFLAFADALDLPPAPVEFGIAPDRSAEREAVALTAGLEGPVRAAGGGAAGPARPR